MCRGPLSNKALGALFKTAAETGEKLRVTWTEKQRFYPTPGSNGIGDRCGNRVRLRVLRDFLCAVGVGLSGLGGHLRIWEILPCFCAIVCIPSHFSAHAHTKKNQSKLPLTDVSIELHLNSPSFSSGLLLFVYLSVSLSKFSWILRRTELLVRAELLRQNHTPFLTIALISQ